MKNEDYSISPEYSIRKVTNLTEFERLRAIWDNLANKQGPHMPFLCFDWFKIWLDHFLAGNRLLILLLYKGSEIVAIAPFLLLREKLKSISVNKIELIGNVYSPIRNFVFNDLTSEEKKKGLLYIFSFLFNDLNGWDVIDLWPLFGGNEDLHILKNIIRENGYKNWEERYSENWYTNGINYTGDEYFNERSRDFKKYFSELRRKRRRFEELGNLEFKMIINDEQVDKNIDYYYEVYGRSWKKRERVGPTFHRDFGKLAAKKGWLRLGMLFSNDAPVATQFCIVSNKVGFFLKIAYDEKYKEYGAGNIVQYETIRYIIDNDKIESIDFGAGSEDYKKVWVHNKREMKRIILFNRSIKGNSLALLHNKILPTFNKNRYLKKFKDIIAYRLH